VRPGDIAQAHQPDEYIEMSEVEAGERSCAGCRDFGV
jgi:acetylornithine deacetylase/succinyl-diaminopimelate desuccinylase-like protein